MMTFNYDEVRYIVRFYDNFRGDLLLVKNNFYSETKKDITYEQIIKIIYKANSIMKKNIQKKLLINNVVSDIFFEESNINNKIAV